MAHINHDADTCARLVVMGVSGCGKSEIGRRLAARLGIEFVEGDDYHPPKNISKMAAGIPLDDTDRINWLNLLQTTLRNAARNKRGLVLSCSALKHRYRDLLRAGDPEVIFVHLAGDRDLIAQHVQARTGHFMPASLLDSQFRELEPLESDEKGITVDVHLDPNHLVAEIIRRLDEFDVVGRNHESNVKKKASRQPRLD
jgi:gluconokinase